MPKVGDFSSCISDIEALVKIGEQIKTDVDNKDISSMISDAIAFVNGAKAAIADCKSKVDLSPLKCIEDGIRLKKDVT